MQKIDHLLLRYYVFLMKIHQEKLKSHRQNSQLTQEEPQHSYWVKLGSSLSNRFNVWKSKKCCYGNHCYDVTIYSNHKLRNVDPCLAKLYQRFGENL